VGVYLHFGPIHGDIVNLYMLINSTKGDIKANLIRFFVVVILL